jgi:hypothetical protein
MNMINIQPKDRLVKSFKVQTKRDILKTMSQFGAYSMISSSQHGNHKEYIGWVMGQRIFVYTAQKWRRKTKRVLDLAGVYIRTEILRPKTYWDVRIFQFKMDDNTNEVIQFKRTFRAVIEA